MRVLYVGTYAEDILDKVGDWRQTGPTHKVLASHEARRSILRSIILPERARLLIHLQHVVVMVHHDVVSQSAIALLHESRNNHIVGSGPYAAFPVASVSLILRVVGSKRCHTVRTVELAGVVEMLHESVEALLGQHIGMQSPVSIDALRRRERVVGILVVEEAVALAPHVLVDVRR